MKINWSRSMADRIVEISSPQIIERSGLESAHRALSPPWGGMKNHFSPPHASLADFYAAEATTKASRFRLTAPVAEIASSIVRDQASGDVALGSAVLPCDVGWLEWKRSGWEDASMIAGVMWERRPGFFFGTCYTFRGDTPNPWLFGSFQFPGESFSDTIKIGVHRRIVEKTPERVEDCKRLVSASSRMLICFCAMLATPRVCETRLHRADERLQLSRLRRGKLPLLSMNEVSLPILENSESGERASGYGDGVRFHDVVAHWRRFHDVSGEEKLTLVKAHWRGNPRKGIVLKERVPSISGGVK